MKEEVLTFGHEAMMMGILTSASESDPSDKKPMVILLNAGSVHRVGPYRQWVDLARNLNQQGFTVFRFDLTGIGDSESRKDRRADIDRAIADIHEMLDYFEQQMNIKRFVLVGLCSGADYGFPVTLVDQRVVGTVFIDAMGYRTKSWYLHHYLPRILNGRGWLKSLKSLSKRFKTKIMTPTPQVNNFVRDFPTQKDAEEGLGQLVNRGVDLLFIYTNSVERYYNYTHQFRAMFPKLNQKNKIQVEFYSDIDHTFTLSSHRQRIHSLIQQWLTRYDYSCTRN